MIKSNKLKGGEKMNNLSEKIISYRAKHDLSQIEFADLCKVTAQTISNIERGVQDPSKLTLAKILNIIDGDKKEEREDV